MIHESEAAKKKQIIYKIVQLQNYAQEAQWEREDVIQPYPAYNIFACFLVYKKCRLIAEITEFIEQQRPEHRPKKNIPYFFNNSFLFTILFYFP